MFCTWPITLPDYVGSHFYAETTLFCNFPVHRMLFVTNALVTTPEGVTSPHIPTVPSWGGAGGGHLPLHWHCRPAPGFPRPDPEARASPGEVARLPSQLLGKHDCKDRAIVLAPPAEPPTSSRSLTRGVQKLTTRALWEKDIPGTGVATHPALLPQLRLLGDAHTQPHEALPRTLSIPLSPAESPVTTGGLPDLTPWSSNFLS